MVPLVRVCLSVKGNKMKTKAHDIYIAWLVWRNGQMAFKTFFKAFLRWTLSAKVWLIMFINFDLLWYWLWCRYLYSIENPYQLEGPGGGVGVRA
jgi:hypothetical protein